MLSTYLTALTGGHRLGREAVIKFNRAYQYFSRAQLLFKYVFNSAPRPYMPSQRDPMYVAFCNPGKSRVRLGSTFPADY